MPLTWKPLTDQDAIDAIRREHTKRNICEYEYNRSVKIAWDRARIDKGGTFFGAGPYLHVPVDCRCCKTELHIQRVYAPERLRRRLAKFWKPKEREMTEILAVCKVAGSQARWLILACGHWYKWTGPQPPKVGADFKCPTCERPIVVKPGA